jgi:hypothetical protein
MLSQQVRTLSLGRFEREGIARCAGLAPADVVQRDRKELARLNLIHGVTLLRCAPGGRTRPLQLVQLHLVDEVEAAGHKGGRPLAVLPVVDGLLSGPGIALLAL